MRITTFPGVEEDHSSTKTEKAEGTVVGLENCILINF